MTCARVCCRTFPTTLCVTVYSEASWDFSIRWDFPLHLTRLGWFCVRFFFFERSQSLYLISFPLLLSLTCLVSRCRSTCGSWRFATSRPCRFLPLCSSSCHCDWGRPLTHHPPHTSPASHCKMARRRRTGRTDKWTNTKRDGQQKGQEKRFVKNDQIRGELWSQGVICLTISAEQHTRKNSDFHLC